MDILVTARNKSQDKLQGSTTDHHPTNRPRPPFFEEGLFGLPLRRRFVFHGRIAKMDLKRYRPLRLDQNLSLIRRQTGRADLDRHSSCPRWTIERRNPQLALTNKDLGTGWHAADLKRSARSLERLLQQQPHRCPDRGCRLGHRAACTDRIRAYRTITHRDIYQ